MILPDGENFNIWGLFQFKLRLGDDYQWEVTHLKQEIDLGEGYLFTAFRTDEKDVVASIQISDVSADPTEPDVSNVNEGNLSTIAKTLRAFAHD